MEIFVLAIMVGVLLVGIFMISHYSKNTLVQAALVEYPAYAPPVLEVYSSAPISRPRHSKPHLKVVSGPAQGKTIVLDKLNFLIERDSPLLALNDRRISRRHALLKWNDGTWYVQDLGSSNGTYLNDKRLVPQRLAAIPPRSRLRFGKSIVAFKTMASVS